MSKELFTAREVAEMFDPPLHPETVRTAHRLGALPEPLVFGVSLVWRAGDLPAIKDAMARRAARRHNRRQALEEAPMALAAS